jgi:hypothetical protein
MTTTKSDLEIGGNKKEQLNTSLEQEINTKLISIDKSLKYIINSLKPYNFFKVYSMAVAATKTALNFRTDTMNMPIHEINVLSIGGGVMTLYLNSSAGIAVAVGDRFIGDFFNIEYTQTIGAGQLICQTRLDI